MSAGQSLQAYAATPPLRTNPDQPDHLDGQRLPWAQKFYNSQNESLRKRDRGIEENIRMLAGQQYTVWNPWLQRWLDVTEWMTDDERRWRQRPVINRLLYWYMITHSRLVENLPIVGFLPSSADRFDAMLAEVMDPIFKTIWREAGMTDVNDLIHAWMVVAGRAYACSRVDPNKGDLKPWVGEATLSLVDQFGQPTGIQRTVSPVPFDKSGQPLARLVDGGTAYEVTGQPHAEHEGQILVDVYSPLQVRGQWGPQPWHQKRWHDAQYFLTVEEVEELYGVKVKPDTFADQFESSGEIFRVLLGGGYYGAAEARYGGEFGDGRNREGLVCVHSLWQAPCAFPGMEETEESPGGRLTIYTRDKILRDGPRPARFKYTSPIRCFDFVRLPGRPSGTTPQEMLNPLQRTMNRGVAQILEHRNMITNPKMLVDSASGLAETDITNKPAEILVVTKRPGVAAFEYASPPPLSEDVWKTQDYLMREFKELGNMVGAEGEAPTHDASGDLVEELRFNVDRWIGATPKRTVEEYGRMAEDWIAWIPTIWDQDKIISYAGEDQITRTITVLPEMFKQGRVNVIPDVESMMPEGRGEREKKAIAAYQMGMFGAPGSPPAIMALGEMWRFPHLGRTGRPGGVDRVTAEQENGKLLLGAPALSLPVFEWYDSMVHLMVHESFMKSPEFLKLPEPVQMQFVMHRQAHVQHLQFVQAQQMAQQLQAQELESRAKGTGEGKGASDAAAHGPPEPAADAA
jgi:hypothetical protein